MKLEKANYDMEPDFGPLVRQVSALCAHTVSGRITRVAGGLIHVNGLNRIGAIGDRVTIGPKSNRPLSAEILRLETNEAVLLAEGDIDGVTIGTPVQFVGQSLVYPSPQWIGKVIDAYGCDPEGTPMPKGEKGYPLRAKPASPMSRRSLGERLETGLRGIDTFLPMVRGQRLGLFAGSGVGKSTFLAGLARNVASDLTVIALIGERGREVRDFVENVLGPRGMKRAIVVAATSDQHALTKRRAAHLAMTIAEYFRDVGAQVTFLCDSITRFADAHRDIARCAGESATDIGYPPSTSQMVMDLCERAGPGSERQGDISALFSVLVAGSDMDEPIADLMRGILDGHIVLDREIAERGRFPAINVLQSVSRSLPKAATEPENDLIKEARSLLKQYEDAKLMVQSGLYRPGTDADLDRALSRYKPLDEFIGEIGSGGIEASFQKLTHILDGGSIPLRSELLGSREEGSAG